VALPVVRSRSGNLVIIYTLQAGGNHPIHGAYLVRGSDSNVWVPCAWTAAGYRISKEKPTDIDIVGEIDRLQKQEDTIRNKQKRVEIVAAGGNCLTCKNTKIALGKRLHCRLKNKLVTQYN